MESILNKKYSWITIQNNTIPCEPTVCWWALSHVSLHVKCQMVRPGERALAQVALERPVSGVFPEMTGQLVGAGEFPSTALPAAVIWLLTCEDRSRIHEFGGLKRCKGVWNAVRNYARRAWEGFPPPPPLRSWNLPVWVRRCAFKWELLV